MLVGEDVPAARSFYGSRSVVKSFAAGIESGKKKKRRAKQVAHTTGLHRHKAAVKVSHNPGRLMMLLFVRVFIVTHLFAFSLSDSKDVRMLLAVCGNDLFPRTSLHPEMAKQYLVKTCKATVFKVLALSAASGRWSRRSCPARQLRPLDQQDAEREVHRRVYTDVSSSSACMYR